MNNFYEEYLEWIRNGDLDWAIYAEELAQKENYPIRELEDALMIGRVIKYLNILEGIMQGNNVSNARKLAKENGFPEQMIDNALVIRDLIKYNEYLYFIRNGDQSDLKSARRLAQKNNYPEEWIDDALRGEQSFID